MAFTCDVWALRYYKPENLLVMRVIQMAYGTGKTNTLASLIKSYLDKEIDSYPKLSELVRSIQSTIRIPESDRFDLSKLQPSPKTIRSVYVRKGQQGFRDGLLELYGEVCAISGNCPREALEAAHICEYKNCSSQRLDNGLLLRADIHKLFDLGLLRIHSDTLIVDIDEKLVGSIYAKYNGVSIRTIGSSYPNKYFFKIREMIEK